MYYESCPQHKQRGTLQSYENNTNDVCFDGQGQDDDQHSQYELETLYQYIVSLPYHIL